MPKRSFRSRLPISENEPHVQRCPKVATDSLHRPRNQSAPESAMPKALRLPRSLRIEVEPLRSPAPATKSRHGPPKHEASLLRRPPRKVAPSPKMRTAPQRERSQGQRPLRPTRFCEHAFEMHFEDFEVKKGIANGNEMRYTNASASDQTTPGLNA